MTINVYKQFANFAVAEPVRASTEVPTDLSEPERALYKLLLSETRGRLEQEFLPEDFVRESILNWANS